MQASGNHTDEQLEALCESTVTPNWTIHVSDVRTVKVSNISLATSQKDIREFFSFPGDILYIEMLRESENTQASYVTFKDSQGADTAVLLTGANIHDHIVTITPVENYLLPPDALPSTPKKPTPAAVKKAEAMVSTMLAKGFILGKDAIKRAKSFDERHHFTSNASATVASIDHKMGLSDKLSFGTAMFSEIMKEVDEKFQFSEMTKSAYAVAEQKASTARSAIMSNSYVLTGASWVSSAYTAVANAVGDVSMMTKEKVEQAEMEKREIIYKEGAGGIDKFGKMHYDGSSAAGLPVFSVNSGNGGKMGTI
ncbi:binding partner of ACD11 1-like [Senna tora]|uniref:Binding partner of ACD11 1-like n=1 Tax=Senna tora TaxID=362788 RepID=A0A834T3C3_9FABA|nr:binding partner of ACD11 1-like [Senna tora]